MSRRRGYPRAPAVAIVLELEAPARLVALASTPDDVGRLVDWLARPDLRELIEFAVRVSWEMQPDDHLDEREDVDP